MMGKFNKFNKKSNNVSVKPQNKQNKPVNDGTIKKVFGGAQNNTKSPQRNGQFPNGKPKSPGSFQKGTPNQKGKPFQNGTPNGKGTPNQKGNAVANNGTPSKKGNMNTSVMSNGNGKQAAKKPDTLNNSAINNKANNLNNSTLSNKGKKNAAVVEAKIEKSKQKKKQTQEMSEDDDDEELDSETLKELEQMADQIDGDSEDDDEEFDSEDDDEEFDSEDEEEDDDSEGEEAVEEKTVAKKQNKDKKKDTSLNESIENKIDPKKEKVKPLLSSAGGDAIINTIRQRYTEYANRCIYMTPIPKDATDAQVKSLTSKFLSIRRQIDNKHSSIKTFAFLEYASPEVAKSEIKALTGRMFNMKPLSVNRMTPTVVPDNRDHINWTRLTVNSLSATTELADLKKIFSRATSIEMPSTKKFKNLGYAFVNYANADVALEDFNKFNEYSLKGNKLLVNFCIIKTLATNNKPSTKAAEKKKPVQEIVLPSKGEKTEKVVGKTKITSLIDSDDETKKGNKKNLLSEAMKKAIEEESEDDSEDDEDFDEDEDSEDEEGDSDEDDDSEDDEVEGKASGKRKRDESEEEDDDEDDDSEDGSGAEEDDSEDERLKQVLEQKNSVKKQGKTLNKPTQNQKANNNKAKKMRR